MSPAGWVLAAVALVLLFWGLGAYNRLVALRNAVTAAWQQLDEALQLRGTVVAPLVAELRGGLVGEGAALDALLTAQARVAAAADGLRPRPAQADAAQALVQAELQWTSAVARMLGLLDLHPELRDAPEAAPHVAVLRDVEPRIVFRRQRFNAEVHAYNDAVGLWPTSVLARLYRFGPAGPL